jgi:hypothetical protein
MIGPWLISHAGIAAILRTIINRGSMRRRIEAEWEVALNLTFQG